MKDPCKEFIKKLPVAACRVTPGEKIRLKKIACVPKGFDGVVKETQLEGLMLLQQELSALQALLYAEHQRKVLIVLQAMDTAGKDGVISHVFRGVNPQGVKVVPFKAPTQVELDHDYLWRVHVHVPAKGEIVIFNRSHYEDVLVTRVHGLIDKDTAKKRYSHIRDFERMLTDEGTIILKFFLHIDRDEQKKRLESRLADKDKNWKFSVADLKERAFWPKYMEVYEDVINATSTKDAPWYVIPANKKWYRNMLVSRALIDTLKELKMKYPPAAEGLSEVKIV